MRGKTGVLLVNLGTPDSFANGDVFRYLNQFLTDPRVIDLPPLRRQMLVRGVIVPLRYKNVAKKYEEIWLPEGSPLKVHSARLAEKLQYVLGNDFVVELGMCVQNPSISHALRKLQQKHVSNLIIFPMYPQYASSTVGAAYENVLKEIKSWETIPQMRLVAPYYDHAAFIRSWVKRSSDYDLKSYDHILFSYHGLPVRHLKNAYPGNSHCYSGANCCDSIAPVNQYCYKAHCMATTRALVRELELKEGEYTVCFQSRLGRDEWIQPYLSEVLKQKAAEGKKNMLVFSPAFVADCLETVHEIAIESHEDFAKAGGENLTLVESLNDDDDWVVAVKEIILSN